MGKIKKINKAKKRNHKPRINRETLEEHYRLFSAEDWIECQKTFDYKCAYCGYEHKYKFLQREHVVAKSKGGLLEPKNVIPACFHCNRSKGSSNMEEWFRKQPFFKEIRLYKIKKYLERMALKDDKF